MTEGENRFGPIQDGDCLGRGRRRLRVAEAVSGDAVEAVFVPRHGRDGYAPGKVAEVCVERGAIGNAGPPAVRSLAYTT